MEGYLFMIEEDSTRIPHGIYSSPIGRDKASSTVMVSLVRQASDPSIKVGQTFPTKAYL